MYGLVILGGVTLVIVGAGWFFNTPFRTQTDFMNWSAVAMEAGIAIFMALIVLAYDKEQKKKFENILNEIQTISKNQEQDRIKQESSKNQRRDNAMSYLHMNFMFLLNEVLYHRRMLVKFYGIEWRDIQGNVDDSEATEDWIKMIKSQTIKIGDDIRMISLSASDVLDPELLDSLTFIQSLAIKPFDLVPEQASFDLADCDALIEWLVSVMKKHFQYTNEKLLQMGVTSYELDLN